MEVSLEMRLVVQLRPRDHEGERRACMLAHPRHALEERGVALEIERFGHADPRAGERRVVVGGGVSERGELVLGAGRGTAGPERARELGDEGVQVGDPSTPTTRAPWSQSQRVWRPVPHAASST